MRRTKRELLRQIQHGPASVEQVYVTAMYRVAIPDDPDPNGGVWIELRDDLRIVRDYGAVHARIDGREYRLTDQEANEVAQLIAETMRARRRETGGRAEPR